MQQIIITGDGSHTLFSEEFNEIYHSTHGAIQESRHVFIENGFNYLTHTLIDKLGVFQKAGPLKIFEVGFGTGLNALLTMIEAEKRSLKIHYETIELYPVPIEIIKELNYTALLGHKLCHPSYHTLHLSTWNKEHSVNSYFTFKKIKDSLVAAELGKSVYQLIYFDAFAPQVQPELWTVEVMNKMYDSLMPGGILVSYCSRSSFQRALNEAGFVVEKIAGPPGKREMVRAAKAI